MADLIELTMRDIHVGEELKWSVYDEKNRLLFKKGARISSEKQLELLLKMGLFRKEEETAEDQDSHRKVSPFDKVSDFAGRLEKIYLGFFTDDPGSENLGPRLERIAQRLVAMVDDDADATLGALHLDHQVQYTILHPIHCAVLCYMVARGLGYGNQKMGSLMGAALSANIGMFGLQETLHSQVSPLTDKQRQAIQEHPYKSVEMLKAAGVSDPLWLKIVEQHHERQDGNGYPAGISGEAFIQEARLLGLADRYHAMISTRTYRSSLPPTEALKQLFTSRGKEVDATLAQLFIKELGVYPPGTYVQLANGETAIVTRRGQDKMKPLVKAVVSGRGTPYMRPLLRSTDSSDYAVARIAPPKHIAYLNFLSLWDYH